MLDRITYLPVLLVGTLRPGPRSADLDLLLGDATAAGATLLPLAPLSSDDVDELVRAEVGQPPGPVLGEVIGRGGRESAVGGRDPAFPAGPGCHARPRRHHAAAHRPGGADLHDCAFDENVPTPLDCAIWGLQNNRADNGDYSGGVRALLAADAPTRHQPPTGDPAIEALLTSERRSAAWFGAVKCA